MHIIETELVKLRKKPLFEVETVTDGFIIRNDADKNDNGLYEFDKIKNLEVKKRKINWFISIFSFVFDLFSAGGTGGIFKKRNQLKLSYDNVEKRIILNDCDMKLAERTFQKIKRHIR